MNFIKRFNRLVAGNPSKLVDIPEVVTSLESADTSEVMQAHISGLLASLLTMAWFVEARDPYTGGHLWRVSKYAHLLAQKAGLDKATVARISLGGFLHDLGKIGIPDAILNKTERLTEAEYDTIKTHPEMGYRMLSGHPLAELIKDAVLLHHERPDGQGYPQGLTQEDIPDMAKIVGICDAFDAMTSSRPYRSGMPIDKALSIIADNLGRQFDKYYGDVFLTLGQSDDLLHIAGHSDEGIPLYSCMTCGPTLVIQKGYQAGEHVYCRNCTGEYEIQQQLGQTIVVPTGKLGRAMDLEATLDAQLIANTVQQAISVMPLTELVNIVANHQPVS